MSAGRESRDMWLRELGYDALELCHNLGIGSIHLYVDVCDGVEYASVVAYEQGGDEPCAKATWITEGAGHD